MFHLHGRLHIGAGEISRLPRGIKAAAIVAVEEIAEQVAPGLVYSGPIPGLSRRHLALTDVDRLQPASLLPLRSVQDDFEPIVTIEQSHIFECIALRAA